METFSFQSFGKWKKMHSEVKKTDHFLQIFS